MIWKHTRDCASLSDETAKSLWGTEIGYFQFSSVHVNQDIVAFNVSVYDFAGMLKRAHESYKKQFFCLKRNAIFYAPARSQQAFQPHFSAEKFMVTK